MHASTPPSSTRSVRPRPFAPVSGSTGTSTLPTDAIPRRGAESGLIDWRTLGGGRSSCSTLSGPFRQSGKQSKPWVTKRTTSTSLSTPYYRPSGPRLTCVIVNDVVGASHQLAQYLATVALTRLLSPRPRLLHPPSDLPIKGAGQTGNIRDLGPRRPVRRRNWRRCASGQDVPGRSGQRFPAARGQLSAAGSRCGATSCAGAGSTPRCCVSTTSWVSTDCGGSLTGWNR